MAWGYVLGGGNLLKVTSFGRKWTSSSPNQINPRLHAFPKGDTAARGNESQNATSQSDSDKRRMQMKVLRGLSMPSSSSKRLSLTLSDTLPPMAWTHSLSTFVTMSQ